VEPAEFLLELLVRTLCHGVRPVVDRPWNGRRL
jgi:hypothetical protein